MIRRPPRSTRTDTLFPYTTPFRSAMAKALSGDTVGRLAAGEPGVQIGGSAHPHRGARLDRRAAEVRQQHRIVAGEQRRVHRRFALEDVEPGGGDRPAGERSEEHTSELQSLMRISYAVFCLKKKTT